MSLTSIRTELLKEHAAIRALDDGCDIRTVELGHGDMNIVRQSPPHCQSADKR